MIIPYLAFQVVSDGKRPKPDSGNEEHRPLSKYEQRALDIEQGRQSKIRNRREQEPDLDPDF